MHFDKTPIPTSIIIGGLLVVQIAKKIKHAFWQDSGQFQLAQILWD